MGRSKKKRLTYVPVRINKDNNLGSCGISKHADNPPAKEQINSEESVVNNIISSKCISSNNTMDADTKSELETEKINVKHPLEHSLVIL